jgi:uncharacterized protein YggE
MGGSVGAADERYAVRLRNRIQPTWPMAPTIWRTSRNRPTSPRPISFSLEDARAARDEALKLAFEAARRDAEVLASAAAGRLGRLAEMKTDRAAPSGFEETITVSAESSIPRTHITAPEVVVAAHVLASWEHEAP